MGPRSHDLSVPGEACTCPTAGVYQKGWGNGASHGLLSVWPHALLCEGETLFSTSLAGAAGVSCGASNNNPRGVPSPVVRCLRCGGGPGRERQPRRVVSFVLVRGVASAACSSAPGKGDLDALRRIAVSLVVFFLGNFGVVVL